MDKIHENAGKSASSGVPFLAREELHGRPLAVVGGGPSASQYIDELRGYSDIFAINGTCQWLASHGIESTLFSVDPDPVLAGLTTGVRRAILASHCDEAAFASLKDADVRIFHAAHIDTHDEDSRPMALRKHFRIVTGTTSACSAPLVALRLGYQHVTYYGCEGSFVNATHSFKDETPPGQLIVRANGRDFITTMQFYLQAQHLSTLIKYFPKFLHERSGGLLRAMIEHPDTWEVVALSEQLRDQLDPTATVPYAA